MPKNGSAPLTGDTVKQGRELDHAGKLIGSQTATNLAETQALHLQRRFRLPVPVARAVAALHYEEARS